MPTTTSDTSCSRAQPAPTPTWRWGRPRAPGSPGLRARPACEHVAWRGAASRRIASSRNDTCCPGLGFTFRRCAAYALLHCALRLPGPGRRREAMAEAIFYKSRAKRAKIVRKLIPQKFDMLFRRSKNAFRQRLSCILFVSKFSEMFQILKRKPGLWLAGEAECRSAPERPPNASRRWRKKATETLRGEPGPGPSGR